MCLLAEVAKDADGGGEHLDIVQRLKCATLPLIAVLQHTENNLIQIASYSSASVCLKHICFKTRFKSIA